MNYKEVIDNIRDLGFSDDAEMEEFGDVIPNSINRAITKLNLSVAPIIEKLEFDIDDTEDGYLYIVMPEEDTNFLDFAETPVLYAETHYITENGVQTTKQTQRYKKFNKYEIESNNTVVINVDELGIGKDSSMSFRIFYKAAHDPFVWTEERLTEEVPLPLKVHHLVPLLASYYVWLEDEPTKAAQYYNDYDSAVTEVLNASSENLPRISILTGGI